MLFKSLTLITALLGVAVSAAPSTEKRQFGVPPSDCKDMQAFENCVSSNPEACFNPLPQGQITCTAFCNPCCDGPGNGVGCA